MSYVLNSYLLTNLINVHSNVVLKYKFIGNKTKLIIVHFKQFGTFFFQRGVYTISPFSTFILHNHWRMRHWGTCGASIFNNLIFFS